MLAAEFRTWFYQAFKVNVPFLTLLSEETTLNSLGNLVHAVIAESQIWSASFEGRFWASYIAQDLSTFNGFFTMTCSILHFLHYPA